MSRPSSTHRCLVRSYDGDRCALDRGHVAHHITADGLTTWVRDDETGTPDNVIGPWWVSFPEMLPPEILDEIGLSEARGATLCITRVCWALLEARGLAGFPLGHRYRPSHPVTGPSPDACYELLADLTVHGGRRFCLRPHDEHVPAPPRCADCGRVCSTPEQLATHVKAMAVMLARVEDCYADAVIGDPNPVFDEARDHALNMAKARVKDAGFEWAEVLKHQHVEVQAAVEAVRTSTVMPNRIIVHPNFMDAIEEPAETFPEVAGTLTFRPIGETEPER